MTESAWIWSEHHRLPPTEHESMKTASLVTAMVDPTATQSIIEALTEVREPPTSTELWKKASDPEDK